MNDNIMLTVLKNINDNMSDLKDSVTDIKKSFDELKGESIKYHTIVDDLKEESKTINCKIERMLVNGCKIKNIEKRVDRLSNVAKHGFIVGVAASFIVGMVAIYVKTSDYLSNLSKMMN